MALRASVVAIAGVEPTEGADCLVLIDGSDTPVTAGGLPGYLPTGGDRLLVERVGYQVEILQFLSRGTPPTIGVGGVSSDDLDGIYADVQRHDGWLSDLDPYAVETNEAVVALADEVAAEVADLQPRHDVLTTITASGVTEDQFLVGVAPNSVAAYDISPFARDALASPDPESMSSALGTWSRDIVGDLLAGASPKAAFYDQFTANSRTAEAI